MTDEAELRRYEEERRERIAQRDAAATPVVGWIMVAALAFLAYDSGSRAAGKDPWLPHGAIAAGCAVAAVVLVAWLVRRRRR